MGIACEVWLNEAEKPLGKFEFDSVPRSGETVSLPAGEEGNYTHYRDCQEFRVRAAIVDPKEVPDGTTQSTPHP